MGSICSCLWVESLEEYMHSDASIYRDCICLRCLAQQLIHAFNAFLHRGEVSAIPSTDQGTASLASAAPITDNSIADTYRSPPRPLPYDDPRCSRLQHVGLVSRREKSSSHFHEEAEPLRRSNNDGNVKSDKWSGSNLEGGSKVHCPESLLKHLPTNVTSSGAYILSSSEDEDVCPTCLDEYTLENPRIIMQCSHHFHLGCIYEWMERSELCPVCGKVMVFDETK